MSHVFLRPELSMIHPCILSGGSGSRLWPLSRKAYPKQFLKIFDGESLFQKTAASPTRRVSRTRWSSSIRIIAFSSASSLLSKV